MADVQLIRCPACSATNRVPRDKIAQGFKPVCGSCKAPLPAATQPFTVTDATFEAQVERSPLPVLVDLWAPWCGPCRMIAPVLDDLASEMAGRINVAKLNIDDNPVTTARFNVQSIPALLIFKDGRLIDRMVGAQPKMEIVRHLDRALAS